MALYNSVLFEDAIFQGASSNLARSRRTFKRMCFRVSMISQYQSNELWEMKVTYSTYSSKLTTSGSEKIR